MGRPQKPGSKSNAYWLKDTTRHLAVRTAYRVKLKQETLTHYSPNQILGCSWPACPVTDIDMLCLDHINNNGKDDRKTPGAGMSIYTLLRTGGFPAGFQTMCFNHNQKKEILRCRGLL